MGGILAGFLSDRKTAGSDAGNAFNMTGTDQADYQRAVKQAAQYQGSQDALNGVQGSNTATDQVQGNSILGQTFGKGGTLDRTTAEEQNLANRGYSLKPEDYEAYGGASDQIAREFGNSGNGLAQALSDRGLGSSNAAAQGFSGLQGNKLEQLGAMSRKIANDRMNMNMQRLGQTRQFLGNLTQQGANDINQQYGRQLEGEKQSFHESQGKAQTAMGFLGANQVQANEQMKQRQQSQETPGWAGGLTNMSNIGGSIVSGMFGGMGKTGKSANSEKKPGGDEEESE